MKKHGVQVMQCDTSTIVHRQAVDYFINYSIRLAYLILSPY